LDHGHAVTVYVIKLDYYVINIVPDFYACIHFLQVHRSRRSANDILGRHKPYDEEAAKAQLQKSLDKLTAGEGPHYK